VQLLFSGAIPGDADERGVTALLGILDVATGRLVHRCEWRPAAPPGPGFKCQFTGFAFADGALWVCAFGEILRFDAWPPRRPSGSITDPGFNDLHHCLPWRGGLAVANTGLETVDLMSFAGELRERVDLLAGEAGARHIEPDRDYRRLPDTKPHRRHVNHLFAVGDELWATQLRGGGAASVSRPEKRLAIAAGMPHDGRWVGDRLLFTTTNGHLVLAHPERGVERAVDLRALTPGLEQLGWCRGACADPRGEDRFFVAFTSLRRSRWREFGYWIRWGQALPPSRIALYDTAAGALAGSWSPGGDPRLVLFQLDALPEARWV
jgi:hypothetical protein